MMKRFSLVVKLRTRGLMFFLFALAGVPMQANTLDLPKEAPVFSVTFPDVWSTALEGDVIISKPKDGNMMFAVLPARGAKTLEEALAMVAKSAGRHFTDFSAGKGDQEVENGITFLGAEAKGKKNGTELRIMIYAFSPDDVQYFGFFGGADEAAVAAHGDTVEKIMNSIWSFKKSKKKEGPISVAYPSDKPAFTVEVPAAWSVDATPERLILKKKDTVNVVQIAPIPPRDAVTDEATAEAWLSKNAGALLKTVGLVRDDTGSKTPSWDMIASHKAFRISYDGNVADRFTEMEIKTFTPDGKTYFYLYVLTRWDDDMMDASDEQRDVARSITPAK